MSTDEILAETTVKCDNHQYEVDNVLCEMLTENTGIAMMDSGGENGRAWQRNQGKTVEDFLNKESVTVDPIYYTKKDEDGDEVVDVSEITYTISVFHHLRNMLYLDDFCRAFNKINVGGPDWDGGYYGVSKEAGAILDAVIKDRSLREWNSYDEQSNLSQTIQGAWLEINNKQYMLLQIHGGADPRGGYTDARLFLADMDNSLNDVSGEITMKEKGVVADDLRVVMVDNRGGYNSLRALDDEGNEIEYSFNPAIETIKLFLDTE